MPKYTLDQLPSWARGMLEEYSAGQLQAGVKYQLPKKQREGNEIVSTTQKTAGTRIPASTMQKFKMGIWKMSDRTLNKLRKMRVRVNYADLRAAGLKAREANKLKRSLKAGQVAAKMRSHAKKLARAKNTKVEYILWGMLHAREIATVGEWDLYVRKTT